MGEKVIVKETLGDGSERLLHVDFAESKVYIETGKHPLTGEPLLRFSSDNTTPYKATVDEPVAAEPVEELPEPIEPEEPIESAAPEKEEAPAAPAEEVYEPFAEENEELEKEWEESSRSVPPEFAFRDEREALEGREYEGDRT
jgi:hypothetical protein